jgi:hypothetical protein
MRSVIIVLSIVLLGVVVRAGVLDFDAGDTSASGTLYTATWSVGCPSYSLGPNQCYSTQPLYCPVDSRGTSFDVLEPHCGGCGCPYGSGTHCPTNGPDPCEACRLTCDDVCSPGWTSCSFDYADECEVINVVCNYPEPEWIGLVVQRRGDINCNDRRGNHLYGTPNGDGTYDDCHANVTVWACPSHQRVQVNTVGTLLDICPDGYIQSEWGTPKIGASDYDVYRPLSCLGDTKCDDEELPPPEPPPSGGCSGDDECTHVAYTEYLCRGSYPDTTSDMNVNVGECQLGYCQSITDWTESDSLDCNSGSRATACAGFPMACVTNADRCSC